MLHVRNLLPDEPLPTIPSSDGLPLGFENLPIDRDWIWIAIHNVDPLPCACLIGSPAHGLFMILRIVATSSAPPLTSLILLRKALRAARTRGCVAWMTSLSDDSPLEVKLMRIAHRNGGKLWPFSGVWAAGELP